MAETPKLTVNALLTVPDLNEAFRPLRLAGIGLEVIEEIGKAREKHGPNGDLADGVGPDLSWLGALQVHGGIADDERPDNSFPSNYEVELAQQKLNDDACADGRQHTRLGVLLEEAFEAGSSVDLKELRAELVQVAAMAVDWIADIDERSSI